jgi:TRAP-type C4-dicarboxylate transport system substrate-binding protein
MTIEAMHTVKEALTSSAQRPAAEAWALLALLLSAQSQHALAIDCVDNGLPGGQPEMLQLLLKIRARILISSGADFALRVICAGCLAARCCIPSQACGCSD